MRVPQGPLRGKRWIVGAGNHSFWLGCYETNKQRELKKRIRPGDIVYDLGAHAGYFSLLGSVLTGPSGRVVSFEPLPANVDFLRRHLQLNGIQNCTVVPAAVSSQEGMARFETSNPSMGRLLNDEGAAVGEIQVKTVTLDGMVSRGEIPPPSIIKCDVEGADLSALQGGEAVLRTYHPAILLDRSDDGLEACCEFLCTLGYKTTTLDGLPLEESLEVIAEWSE